MLDDNTRLQEAEKQMRQLRDEVQYKKDQGTWTEESATNDLATAVAIFRQALGSDLADPILEILFNADLRWT